MDNHETLEQKIKVGDKVNWESDGALQFKEPKKVKEVMSYQGDLYASLYGEKTGFPVSQLIRIESSLKKIYK